MTDINHSGSTSPLQDEEAALDAAAARLNGRTVFMSGGSRGIGLAIAKRLARGGANIALIAKTTEPHPKLPGTIYSAAEEITAAGGQALPIAGDIRDPDQIETAVARTVERFGGVDIAVNNASALNLSGIADLEPKRFDLLIGVNVRGTFCVTRACLPHLLQSSWPHVLTLSPPLNLDPKWFNSSAYTISKYGMTVVTLGVAEEYRERGVGANCLWPRTAIATAAVNNLLGGEDAMRMTRTPEIVADAAVVALAQNPKEFTGQALLDDELLAGKVGISDFSRYASDPSATRLIPDFFLDPESPLP
jgi:citronellol/citronellal dehydrogenase